MRGLKFFFCWGGGGGETLLAKGFNAETMISTILKQKQNNFSSFLRYNLPQSLRKMEPPLERRKCLSFIDEIATLRVFPIAKIIIFVLRIQHTAEKRTKKIFYMHLNKAPIN